MYHRMCGTSRPIALAPLSRVSPIRGSNWCFDAPKVDLSYRLITTEAAQHSNAAAYVRQVHFQENFWHFWKALVSERLDTCISVVQRLHIIAWARRLLEGRGRETGPSPRTPDTRKLNLATQVPQNQTCRGLLQRRPGLQRVNLGRIHLQKAGFQSDSRSYYEASIGRSLYAQADRTTGICPNQDDDTGIGLGT